MYDVGIVGCGVIGTRLAESFAEHPDTTVAAACDVDAERAESFAAERDATAYTDHGTMLAAEDLDVLYVGVPPVHHREIAGAGLEAGVNVICEKPIAEDAETGAELAAMEAEADLVTAVNLPFRYTPGFVELRERVAAGDVGEPRRVSLDFRFPQWPREWQDVDWLRSREQGGPTREVGTHFLFGVRELFGGIDRVSAEVQYAGPDACEESVVGWFEAGGDAGGAVDRPVHGTIDLLTDHEQPEENAITVTGTEGELTLTEWFRLTANPGTDAEEELCAERESTTLTLVDEFVTALEGGDADLVSFAEATAVQRVVDAVFDSGGDPVDTST
ncbi:Gfo/Idh/MocA family oxidoreductase [Halobaculum sp. WSA2]|uniref:Gfo/Idh/MocA family oxidoreductase n=1 Tax=Halobaculum saliterrae TaxID=2073113 RepID=A0A6B0SV13_9EURY|nr:Gfo/Idh/MocA family oxidoreductase [Halobaculum saliterrae]MXR42447.1 Gfo/Idh/MocA family oxidoreductase [Halobaculum saliterrae]